MPLSTAELRREYDPPCAAKGNIFLQAYEALDTIFEKWQYRVRKEDTGAANCRKITNGSGWSLHAYSPGDKFTFWTGVTIATGLAVDINWRTNPYGSRLVTDMPRDMVERILALRTNDGQQVWGWGGNYRTNKDAMHFEIVCSKKSLATGIRGATVPPLDDVEDAPVSTSPSTCFDKEGKHHVFVRGMDNKLWCWTQASGWVPLGGILTGSGPDASLDPVTGNINVVVRGADGAGRTYSKSLIWDDDPANRKWAEWVDLGGKTPGE